MGRPSIELLIVISAIIAAGIIIALYASMYGDFDGDGLSNNQEWAIGTNPMVKDSDGDGLSDGDEIQLKINPKDPDSDDDGLVDGAEISFGTDPLNPDTDGDGYKDGVDLCKKFDAKIRITIIYWRELDDADSTFEQTWYGELPGGDVYFIVRVYAKGKDIAVLESPPCYGCTDEKNLLCFGPVNVPDNVKTITIVIEAWDADDDTDDQYDISEEAYEDRLTIKYDITREKLTVVSDGRADGLSGDLDALIKVEIKRVA